MKALRLLAAGAALFAFASCGKEYNSIPGGNNTDNPILPLGVAGEGQIRYNLWEDKIRISNAYWSDTTFGTSKIKLRTITGILALPDSTLQAISIQTTMGESPKNEYKAKDSLSVSLGFNTNPPDPTGESVRIYTNQVPGTKGSAMTVTFTQQDATTLRGTFSGKLARQYSTTDTNDVVEINNGTFWVKKK